MMREKKSSLRKKCIVVSVLLFGIYTIYYSDSENKNSTRYLSESTSRKCAGWCFPHAADWEEKCTYKGCAGCKDHCTTQEEEIQVKESMDDNASECAGWCFNHEAKWEEKCTYNGCAGCKDQCDTKDSSTQERHENVKESTDHVETEHTDVQFCEGWCIAHPVQWRTKCLYKGCMGCGQCLDENESLSEEPKTTRTKMDCRGWCPTRPDSWEKKCTYYKKLCSGCDECKTIKPVEEKKTSEKSDCQGWCFSHPISWDHKCAYYNMCSGCDECTTLTSDEDTTPVSVDRIYYINMDHRTDKREFMESWLEPFSKKYSVPYQRISGKSGDTGDCLPGVRDEACIGLTGLLYTNWDIMDNYNTTGITLVLEDDYVIRNYNKLLKSIEKAPADWDVLRFDSWQQPRVSFPRFYMRGLGSGFRTSSPRNGYFCGGTHITVWRGDKVEKLRNHWDMHPRLPIDCALANDNITSYFLMTRVGKLDRSRGSDVPKLL